MTQFTTISNKTNNKIIAKYNPIQCDELSLIAQQINEINQINRETLDSLKQFEEFDEINSNALKAAIEFEKHI